MVEADFNALISKSIEKVNRNTDVKIKDYMDENVLKTTNGNYIEPKNILNYQMDILLRRMVLQLV